MSREIVRTGTAGSFFERARGAARRADQGKPFDGAITLSFEDPQRMFAVLSAARREPVRAVIGRPMTVAELTGLLQGCARIATAAASPWTRESRTYHPKRAGTWP